MERRVEPHRTDLLERKKEEIGRRLRLVCEHIPESEFSSLVERMAQIEIKYAHRSIFDWATGGQRPRTPRR